jgi:CMP-N,N'-diacetyllegionaminic acid synthase
MPTLAVIPARGGSKGIPHKNIALLAGIPLIEYSIQAALKAVSIQHIVVTSDDDQILKIAGQFPIQLLKRPAELATDKASSDAVIEHAINHCSKIFSFDHIVFLQPTSPLRTGEDIDQAWKLYERKKPQLLLSTLAVESKIHKMFIEDENGFLKGVLSPEAPFMARQELPKMYLPNGAIYICSVAAFNKKQTLPRESIISFEMPAEKSIDIDASEDLLLAEKYLSYGKQV